MGKDSVSRKFIIVDILSKVKKYCSKDMIVYRDDTEHHKGITNVQKQQVETQACYVLKSIWDIG